jgi:penicillin-binding protein 2
MANAMCIIANKGYYYTPHFVERLENEQEQDTAYINRYKIRHDVLTYIPAAAFNDVIEGMSDVVKVGTARGAQIEGIEVCAKTGTAENYTVLDGRRIKLPDNSMFVCFAPKENPKIAIAVFVQNAGFGATWAAPIARMMMEKYLNDSLSTRSKADSARIEAANLMPAYFKRLQYREDSIRAFKWFQTTRDSAYIERYTEIKPVASDNSLVVAQVRNGSTGAKRSRPRIPAKPAAADSRPVFAAIIPERSLLNKKGSIQ